MTQVMVSVLRAALLVAATHVGPVADTLPRSHGAAPITRTAGVLPVGGAPEAAATSAPGPRVVARFTEPDVAWGTAVGAAGEAAPGAVAQGAWGGAPEAADTPVARPRAVEYSDAYYTRLEIHRIGSYVILPMFGAEYLLGQNLLNSYHPASWVRPAHRVVAYGVAAVFTVNTLTGLWNLWDSRRDSNGRTRRLVHVVTMLASDAGFVATGATVRQAKLTSEGARRHRNLALGSIGLSAASTIYMWLTK